MPFCTSGDAGGVGGGLSWSQLRQPTRRRHGARAAAAIDAPGGRPRTSPTAVAALPASSVANQRGWGRAPLVLCAHAYVRERPAPSAWSPLQPSGRARRNGCDPELRPQKIATRGRQLGGQARAAPRRHRLRGADLLPSAMPETEDPPPAEQDALELGLVAVRNAGGSKGKGLFALADIPEGTFIGEYTGQVLTEEAYLQRYPDADPEYAFEVNDNYIIDAVNPEQSSFLRYANHCPDADSNLLNTVFRKKRQRHKEVKFFASRSIASGEELQFDYGEQFWMRRKHLLASQPAVVSYEYFCDGCGTDVKDGAQCHVCPECKEDLFILCPSCFTSANAGLNDELLADTMHEHTLVMTTRASEYDPDVIAQTT